MCQNKDNDLPLDVRMIRFADHKDSRGTLTVAEGDALPFEVKRVFWINEIPEGAERGNHAHKTCSEIVVPVCGSFTMIVGTGKDERSVKMERSDEGILLPPGVWCRMNDFAQGTVLMVLSDEEYDYEGYILQR